MITAEAKGIPLVHEMARQSGENHYLIARKAVKVYMPKPFGIEVHSITTAKKQQLYIDQNDVDAMKGKRVLIIDDVISTGNRSGLWKDWFREAGGEVVGRMAILAEGDAQYRDDITYLEHLPLLNSDGTPKK